MIRKFQQTDLDAVMDIWLRSNIEVHGFIPAKFWEGKFTECRSLIPSAEVYVSENENGIDGFIGLSQDYIEGIFVDKSARTKGIGTALINTAKKGRDQLFLSVYTKNRAAIDFYIKQGFKPDCLHTDEETSEQEYIMLWERNGGFPSENILRAKAKILSAS